MGALRRPTTAIVFAALVAICGIVLASLLVDVDRPAVDVDRPAVDVATPKLGEETEQATGPFTDGDEAAAVPPLSESHLPGVAVRVNERAGYLFSYPATWKIDGSGATDRLVNPTGEISMTFEVAPQGSLESASDRMIEEATERYTNVELLEGAIERTPQGLLSLVVGGHGVTPNGGNVQLLVITIRGVEGNRAITIRFSAGSDPVSALPVIQEVVGSFRIATADGSTASLPTSRSA